MTFDYFLKVLAELERANDADPAPVFSPEHYEQVGYATAIGDIRDALAAGRYTGEGSE